MDTKKNRYSDMPKMQISQMESEKIKNIIGYEHLYKISSFGKIWSIKRNLYYEGWVNLVGYYCVSLSVKGVKKEFLLHRLLAKHFIPNPENKRTVNHKDGNKLNNSLDNLEWATDSENNYHAYKIGLRKVTEKMRKTFIAMARSHGKLEDKDVIKIRSMYQEGFTQQYIADLFEISNGAVSMIIRGKRFKDRKGIIQRTRKRNNSKNNKGE